MSDLSLLHYIPSPPLPAVLPVENSLGGSIHRNYDLLLRHRLHIVGEVQLPVHHCLLQALGIFLTGARRRHHQLMLIDQQD
uniref:Prephenate dehydratase domain-containing protein n=1 Tax=Oryza punctata TaxID=4537 RepID=A0A0E0M4M7_ORYPU